MERKFDFGEGGKNLVTEVVLIVDRSGSMCATRSDAEGGVNSFIEAQKKEPGTTYVTIVEFDHEYNVVCSGVLAEEVRAYKLIPRGNTALLDAIAKGIAEVDKRDSYVNPDLVVCVIVTDGEENSSTEMTRERIKKLIETKEATGKWKFTFLGANQDAFAEAGSLGVTANATKGYVKASNAFQDAVEYTRGLRGATLMSSSLNSVSYGDDVEVENT